MQIGSAIEPIGSGPFPASLGLGHGPSLVGSARLGSDRSTSTA